jgi:hypothetical protein
VLLHAYELKCAVSNGKPLYGIRFTPAAIQVGVHVDNCGLPENRCFSVGAAVSLITAKCLSKSQAILGRHHAVKNRVDCAGKKVETSCNIGKLMIAVCLFTHHLFMNAAGRLDYTALNDCIINE